MVNDDTLTAGEKIDVEIEEGNSTSQYKSRIEEIIDSGTVIITRPIGTGRYAYLSVDQVFKLIFFRKDSAYYFNARVVERIKYKNSVSIKVCIISDKQKLQRRSYFRLEVSTPVRISYSVSGHKGLERITKNLYTADISGGGIRVFTGDKIDAGTELELLFGIPGIENIPLKGEVVRSIPSIKNKDTYEIGVQFVDIEPHIGQKIVKYIFTKQRQLLRRGFE